MLYFGGKQGHIYVKAPDKMSPANGPEQEYLFQLIHYDTRTAVDCRIFTAKLA